MFAEIADRIHQLPVEVLREEGIPCSHGELVELIRQKPATKARRLRCPWNTAISTFTDASNAECRDVFGNSRKRIRSDDSIPSGTHLVDSDSENSNRSTPCPLAWSPPQFPSPHPHEHIGEAVSSSVSSPIAQYDSNDVAYMRALLAERDEVIARLQSELHQRDVALHEALMRIDELTRGRGEALRAELSALKMSALIHRARDGGVDQHELDAALDGRPTMALPYRHHGLALSARDFAGETPKPSIIEVIIAKDRAKDGAKPSQINQAVPIVDGAIGSLAKLLSGGECAATACGECAATAGGECAATAGGECAATAEEIGAVAALA